MRDLDEQDREERELARRDHAADLRDIERDEREADPRERRDYETADDRPDGERR